MSFERNFQLQQVRYSDQRRDLVDFSPRLKFTLLSVALLAIVLGFLLGYLVF